MANKVEPIDDLSSTARREGGLPQNRSISVEVRKLNKSYGQQLALRDVSFSFHSGEVQGPFGGLPRRGTYHKSRKSPNSVNHLNLASVSYCTSTGGCRFSESELWSFLSMCFLRSSVIRTSLGTESYADQAAGFYNETALSNQILRL